MSTRVYLQKTTYHITPSEDTLVCIRIQLSRATVTDLHRRLQHAYQCEQSLRSSRQNALPVKRLDGALVMGHKYLAGAVV